MTEKGIHTILIVDDDRELLALLRTEMGQDYNILSAHNGEEGLILALLHRPDLIISDIQMPELNGWDFCHILRQIPSTKNIPFIFLSRLHDLPEKIKALRVGGDDFIAKPFSLSEIGYRIKLISEQLQNRKRFLQGKAVFGLEMNSLLVDLLSFLRETRRSGIIRYYRVNERGIITVSKGNIVDASMEGDKGEVALRRILRGGSGEVAFKEQETQGDQPIIDWNQLIISLCNNDE